MSLKSRQCICERSLVFGQNAVKLRIATHFRSYTSGYRLLSSRVIKIIQNDSLRKSISDLYESHYLYYAQYEQKRIQLRIQHIAPYLIRHFSFVENHDFYFMGYYEADVTEYQMLRSEKEFRKLILAILLENSVMQSSASKTRRNIIQLGAFLDEMLNETHLKTARNIVSQNSFIFA